MALERVGPAVPLMFWRRYNLFFVIKRCLISPAWLDIGALYALRPFFIITKDLIVDLTDVP